MKYTTNVYNCGGANCRRQNDNECGKCGCEQNKCGCGCEKHCDCQSSCTCINNSCIVCLDEAHDSCHHHDCCKHHSMCEEEE